ncbi:NAD(P)-dependent oxidoreductase [Roseomonas sp. E05]|uniref:NAD-dependent epimerase/dehydratase family protein n=1 Tax=Roseomonas sp. E05 TaxID=3046310 RepID=UPI0024BB2D86|nr:NAD(P)-dependent oxidoreductase [Roseomonas sp. E05]MDJ0388566.1 NAD(P)-dependent oxidoreductase [Roseomonas sp. E05]
MAILVTGGAGFVGLNLVEALLARGEHVVVYGREDLPTAAAAAFAHLPGRLDLVRGDVLDAAALGAVFTAHKIHAMFPFAAITAGPQREAEQTEAILEVNLLGAVGQLRAARAAGVGRIVFPSSISVYGESQRLPGPMREDTTPPVPVSVYGITKYAGERLALRLRDLWGLDLVCARIGGVFGPWERDTGVRDLLTPHMHLAVAALRGEAAVLPATLLPRPWIYARDLARGLLLLLDAPRPRWPVYNISAGVEWGARILLWAEALARHYPAFRWRQSADPAEVTVPFHDEGPRAVEDIGRMREEFGYAPEFLPEAAYADYLRWLQMVPDYLVPRE